MKGWSLVYDSWKPEQQRLREALCTLGNGYMATRGAAEEARAGRIHYPGTYLAGAYNRLQTKIAGRLIENEDLVNWPNWLWLRFRLKGGAWFGIESVELLEFRQELDLQCGVLTRRLRFRDRKGHESSLVSRRLVHMGDPHLAAIEWTLTAHNWSGRIEIESGLDGTVRNEGVERYRRLSNEHLEFVEAGPVGEEAIYLVVRTNQSGIRMAQAARTQAFVEGEPLEVKRSLVERSALILQRLKLDCEAQRPIRIEKVVSVYTSRDRAISYAADAARQTITRVQSFEKLLASHRWAWNHLWHRCDIEIKGNQGTQLNVRLNIFHLMQSVSMHTIDLDVGVPARGLHGEAYRGHIFWDELYIFPFLNLSIPELIRALIMYRYRRLPAARRAAADAGFRGAMYPWQSGSDGREESQVVHLNPLSGRWIPDSTHLQRHLNAAIAYNAWQYYQATEDREFLSFYGAELILAIARFWASIAVLNPGRQRYEIRGVVGPDEYHTAYPDSDEPGLNNNAYTNVMAAWNLHCALEVVDLLDNVRRVELLGYLGIGEEELDKWADVSRRLFVPFHDDGIISQFEGYEKLEEFDWEGYRAKYGDIHRLDRILESEGDTPNRYKAAKQADVLMLFYLFSMEELEEIFSRLGYEFTPEIIPRNIEYYCARTSHGSSLSRVVHSWVLARSDREGSWQSFQKALKSDLEDIQGGTTPEGIHLGAMAGSTDLLQRCYVGIETRANVLWIDPLLPLELSEVKLRVRYRGHWISVHVMPGKLRVSLERGGPRPAMVGFRRKVHELKQGESREFEL
ncbi:MAG: glycosyl hydrolase family 65 protein [Acidobacteriota bacterium]